MFTFDERPESGSLTMEPMTIQRIYCAAGEDNEDIVRAYALSLTPGFQSHPRGFVVRKDVQVQRVGHKLYNVVVPYEKPVKPATGNITWSFSTQGATVNIKAAKEHVRSFPDDGPWHAGSINVKSDGEVEGADIIIPCLKLSVTFTHPLGIVTFAYARALANATGKTNAVPFLGFPAGELLFLGADGSDGTEADASVVYNFAASYNATGLTIGDIADIAKAGHDFIWIEFYDAIESGTPVRKPKRVHVERVYDAINFALALGWGG